MKRNRALPLTITLGSVLVVLALGLTTLWNIVMIYNTLQLRPVIGPNIWRQWLILGIGSFLFVVIITGITLFIIFMSRQIMLNQTQKNFIDSMTHELRTPITSLKLYVETLQRHQLEGPKREQFLRIMLQDVEYLDSLVGHVLESAKAEYGQAKPETEVELDEYILDSIALIQRRYQLAEGCLQYQPTGLKLLSDPHALRLILANLIDNAVKYSPSPPVVKIRTYQEADRIKIEVSDQGHGLLPAERRRIFRRFYRGSQAHQAKGSGLGLFIVKESVKALHGTIEVESAGRDQGSIFRICFENR